MVDSGWRLVRGCSIAWLLGLASLRVWAGGSALNTVVVLNQASSNSCALGNYFCERRQVPPENVLFINWNGGNIAWSSGDFQTNLLNPLLAMLAARQLTNQIDYVVLSMDIPFQTTNGTVINSTTSVLFYGMQGIGANWKDVTNSYAGSEQVFSKAHPATAPGYSFLATMLTGDSLDHAKMLVDQGVTSDGTFPTQPVVLAKTTDPLRNARYALFDNAIFNARLAGSYTMYRTNLDSPLGLANLLGFEFGESNFPISPNMFVPGAIADSLTSFGGIIFGPNGQTTLLAFLNAGAAGSYGTVVEPSPSLDKFPNPQVYFYQARGFSLAECYYQSLLSPYEGLIVAEPLAAPFQRTGSGFWSGVASNATLRGTASLSVQFYAADPTCPLQQVDLFADGKYYRTLTNIAPASGNLLTVTLNSTALNYAVPANATLAGIATSLAGLLNAPANTNATKTIATAFGDRVELHSIATNRPTAPVNLRVATDSGSGLVPPSPPLLAASSTGTATALTTFLSSSRDTFLNSEARGIKACTVNGIMQVGTWLQLTVTKNSGIQVTLAATNQTSTGTVLDLTGQLVSLINSNTDLQALDGLSADDFGMSAFLSAGFNLRARTRGFSASRLKVSLTGAASLVITPGSETPLDDNLADLQPRNHIYVRAGAANLLLNFALDTRTLGDGYHELTAVAYEGSNVRSQTRTTLPMIVSNSPLNATMTLLDLPASAPVQGSYHIRVAANTNNVTALRLYSTGGQMSSVSNQSSATFTVNATALGVGLHPFYAVAETAAGLKYRVAAQWVRFVP